MDKTLLSTISLNTMNTVLTSNDPVEQGEALLAQIKASKRYEDAIAKLGSTAGNTTTELTRAINAKEPCIHMTRQYVYAILIGKGYLIKTSTDFGRAQYEVSALAAKRGLGKTVPNGKSRSVRWADEMVDEVLSYVC